MKPLIEITTVPIQIEMKTTNAKLEYARGTAEMEVSRDKGGLQIKSLILYRQWWCYLAF